MRNFFIFMMLFLAACSSPTNRLTDGRWRGVFVVPDNEIPFMFEVSNAASNPVFTLINDEERIDLSGITYRHDSVFIPIPAYDAVMKAQVRGDYMSGMLVKLYANNPGARVPFTAQKSILPRFIDNGEKATVSLDGTWEITVLDNDSAKQVGIFRQTENGALTGSILTSTGDYRYFEGSVHGNRFQLSAFGGMTPYLIQGQFSDADHFTAELLTPTSVTRFKASRNPDATLPDAYTMTSLKEGYTSLRFQLPDLDGRMVSLSDPKYQGKVVIVSILGSWCPNCIDETAFLVPWYKANRQRGVEIVGLAFERKDDMAYAKQQLERLKAHYDVTYDILFAGKVGEETTSKVLPGISKVMSYPTTIFIDKKGKVRKIHTGFSGPATGQFYEAFKTEFNQTVDELLAEKPD